MKNMTIRKRILLGFGLLVILTAVVGGIGIWKNSQVKGYVEHLVNTNLELAVAGARIKAKALTQELDLYRYLIHGNQRFMDAFHKNGELENKYLKTARDLVNGDSDLVRNGWGSLIGDAAKAHDSFAKEALALIDAVHSKNKVAIEQEKHNLKITSYKLDEAIQKFSKINIAEARRVAAIASHQSGLASTLMLIVSIVAVLIGLVMGFFIARTITRPVNRIVEGLEEGSDQVAAASGQIASASQSQAEGASEQAASIEETSSALEELSSMTKQNAGHASEASNMMNEVDRIVKEVDKNMEDMVGAMTDITKSSEETGKIIKEIDEIAFQTNLLALNAAVEAARAGEAGAGFAVVAEEVRNLAMRASGAAGNTAELIENTIKSVQNGNESSQSTQKAFKENIDVADKVKRLVEEIAAASSEQAQGIEQINLAVGEMDKVVQNNAANAEESASASEEMNAQAEQLRDFVAELVKLAGGNGSRAKTSRLSENGVAREVLENKLLAAPDKRVAPNSTQKMEKATAAIPFDDDF